VDLEQEWECGIGDLGQTTGLLAYSYVGWTKSNRTWNHLIWKGWSYCMIGWMREYGINKVIFESVRQHLQ